MLVPEANADMFDDYNFDHASNRIHIERAFRMLVNKWAISWHPLDVKFERRIPLINFCFIRIICVLIEE